MIEIGSSSNRKLPSKESKTRALQPPRVSNEKNERPNDETKEKEKKKYCQVVTCDCNLYFIIILRFSCLHFDSISFSFLWRNTWLMFLFVLFYRLHLSFENWWNIKLKKTKHQKNSFVHRTKSGRHVLVVWWPESVDYHERMDQNQKH